MTKTKINGEWVTTSSGEQIWTGTKAQLAAGLANGTIPEGAKVMVTNDYDGDKETGIISIKDIIVPNTEYIASPITRATYKRVGKVVDFCMEFYTNKTFTNLSSTLLFGTGLFNGTDLGQFPKPAMTRMVAELSTWATSSAPTIIPYFFFSGDNYESYMSVPVVDGVLVHGTYITSEE